MKKLTDLDEESLGILSQIEKNLKKRWDEDPGKFTWVCPDCRDTGYVVTDKLAKGVMHRFGRPCEDCEKGLQILEADLKAKREKEEKAKRNNILSFNRRVKPYQPNGREDD